MNKNISTLLQSQKNSSSPIHGIFHWKRVAKNGKYLGGKNGADLKVIEYFAFLHDSQRLNDGKDLKHGHRAKAFIQSLIKDGKLTDLSPKQQDQLMYACEYHTHHNIQSNDITILTCIDSDRLDLIRLGIHPDPHRLFTKAGKRVAEDLLNS
jgi:uncharacterized protein